jgi:hypothetical protein
MLLWQAQKSKVRLSVALEVRCGSKAEEVTLSISSPPLPPRADLRTSSREISNVPLGDIRAASIDHLVGTHH